ncbi:sigma-54 dependent transcriptional regulator [Pelagibius sp. Alg239-R121]|uniref:sigma-54-dependent transcriptional regulator n=1 Tax=Pelagibius sp. Alg239-R121 TaxID=2993448 RepID=UPI0024A6C288|nr:sigma-54 dependent transcriptional regulator [Pelagibius sp. Alg239-R121]
MTTPRDDAARPCNLVYFVDDEAAMRAAIKQWLSLADFEVVAFERADDALQQLSPDFPGVILSDVKMPRMNGLELLRRVSAMDKDLPVVLMTGHGDVPMAVDAMKEGAYDFIEKPFEPEQILEIVHRAVEKRRLVLENRRLRQQVTESTGPTTQLLGHCPAMDRLRADLHAIADTDASVLILGETGTGKEVVARRLHELSSRAANNFVAVNATAIPEQIFESELFGHEAGAFTGAQKKRVGKMEHASGGTLFLDEIGSMPLSLQPKLLRALQENRIERLGSNDSIPIDLRTVTAANIDIEEASTEGRFREDLLYRLNVITLRIPPLRERGDDIVTLFEHFKNAAATSHDRPAPALSDSDIALLMAHTWRGNIRELKNTAERHVLFANTGRSLTSILRPLDQSSDPEASDASLAERVDRFERTAILRGLKTHHGNIQAVCDALDIPRRTLNQKMLRHGLNRQDFIVSHSESSDAS